MGLDVEDSVLTHARALIAAANLTHQIGLAKVAPGPLPLPQASFDLVFSKDSIIHIPDKHALMAEVYRVLRPGGWFRASDWLIGTEGTPSPAMQAYIAAEGLDFGMASPATYHAALHSAGFTDITVTSRNLWYRALARTELARLQSDQGAAIALTVGRDFVDQNIDIWTRMITVLDSGEHCPSHLAAPNRAKPKPLHSPAAFVMRAPLRAGGQAGYALDCKSKKIGSIPIPASTYLSFICNNRIAMADVTDLLRLAPFNLDQTAVDWVRQTKAAMTTAEKVGQLFVFLSMGRDPGEPDRLARLKPAGITRNFTSDAAYEAGFITAIQAQAKIPLFVSADLEGSRMSLPFGTAVPNPLALAAVDDVQASRTIARIMATEGRAIGINWSFTPVLDINAAFRSAIVATRSFGADIDVIERQSLAQIAEFQSHGLAATVKHWPGEGHDDRDQHLLTTINPLSIADWQTRFGRLYKAAIGAGVMSVMSAHIAFPAYILAKNPDAGIEAYRPASISRALNIDLLRGELGFNGLIVSDSTGMAGFGAWGHRTQMLPQVIENGCDIILFSPYPDADVALITAAVADGRISPERLDQAVTRVLGLKAWTGLHHGAPAVNLAALGLPADQTAADAVTARAPTLVKDVRGLLPLSPTRHRRVLVLSTGVVMPSAPHPLAFDLPQMLRDEGFEVTMFETGMVPVAADWDLMLYLFGEETLLARGRIFLDWARITGHFGAAMARYWHDIPTLMVSFGYPYYLYDAPRAPTYVNAYTTMVPMQRAVVDCLLGRAEWNRTSPVDAFCGLPDARF